MQNQLMANNRKMMLVHAKKIIFARWAIGLNKRKFRVLRILQGCLSFNLTWENNASSFERPFKLRLDHFQNQCVTILHCMLFVGYFILRWFLVCYHLGLKLSTQTKIAVYRACIVSTLLYSSESWATYAGEKKRLHTFRMRCFRRILSILWTDEVLNDAYLKEQVFPRLNSPRTAQIMMAGSCPPNGRRSNT